MMDFGMPVLIEMPSLEDTANLCNELNLRFIELNMNLPQFQCGEIDIDEFARVARDYGIYYTIHLDENLNPCDFNPLVADAWIQTVRQTVAIATKLRIPILNMHLSRGVYFTLPDGKAYLYRENLERYLETIARFRRDCEQAVRASEIKICIENCEGFTDFQRKALEILLESPVFALTFDIGHNFTSGGDDENVILNRDDKLVHFHFHDATDRKNHLALGDGAIDLPKYFSIAEKRNCRAVLEVKTVDGLKRSVLYLNRDRFLSGK